jgi:WD40 repeat protein
MKSSWPAVFLIGLVFSVGGRCSTQNPQEPATLKGHDGCASIGNDQQRKELWTFTGHAEPISSVAFGSRSWNVLAAGNADGVVRLWDVRTGKLQFLHKADRQSLIALDLGPNGENLTSYTGVETIKIFEVATTKELVL